MKILSAYIAGFGKFVKRKMDLSQDIVQIKEDNGWGKTTFVDFLECMFYGMDEGRKKSILENFRVKYKPWHSETFGGTLTFLVGGRTYRIERTFGKTPSFDTAKIYDERNNPVYDFGDKCEKLGETLFGLDRESYRRSVYLPQGEIAGEGFPQDIKGKLAALLTANDEKNGKKDAVTLLDEAERALRSKRVPKTGKLDVIDAELATLDETRRRLQAANITAKELYEKAETEKKRLAAAQAEWQTTDEKITAYNFRKERAANATLQQELQNTEAEAVRRLQHLNAFFGETPPEQVNLQGLQSAIDEYYAVKQSLEALQENVRRGEELHLETEKARIQLTACEKNVETYQSLLAAQKKNKGKEERSKKEERKKAGKKGGYALIGVCLFLAVLLLGLTQVEAQPALGLGALFIGFFGTLICMRSFWKNTLAATPNKADGFADKQIDGAYKQALAAHTQAQNAYRAFCDRQKEFSAAQTEYDKQTARMQALETAVKTFLSHFALEQTYDYRAVAALIKQNVDEYARWNETLKACRKKLLSLPAFEPTDMPIDEGEFARLGLRRAQLEEEKISLQKAQATYYTQAENYAQEGAKLAACEEKYQRLQAEKTRLENRLLSIKTARELILRAREGIAAQYLVPVENACKRYAKALGFVEAEKWRFNTAALPLAEEDGALKESEYYSAGMRGLWDLCIRLALTETLFQKEPPVLIFDDCLRDFDDDKTEKGKLLIKELSRKYQIIYCTCKEERKL